MKPWKTSSATNEPRNGCPYIAFVPLDWGAAAWTASARSDRPRACAIAGSRRLGRTQGPGRASQRSADRSSGKSESGGMRHRGDRRTAPWHRSTKGTDAAWGRPRCHRGRSPSHPGPGGRNGPWAAGVTRLPSEPQRPGSGKRGVQCWPYPPHSADLRRVGMRELADLQVDDDKAAQAAVEEQQVNTIPLVADPQSLLTPHEGEVAAQFQQEVFELVDQGVFQVVLGVLVFEVEELQHERVFDLFLGREEIARLRHRPFAEHRRLVPGEQGPLIELAADLTVELADRPAAPKRLVFVETAGVLVLDGEQPDVV